MKSPLSGKIRILASRENFTFSVFTGFSENCADKFCALPLTGRPREVYNSFMRHICTKGIVTMDEKKRARMMKVFRVVALILAIVMIIGVIVQAFIF